MGSPYYTMDPNTGFPAGFPVPAQSPQNQMSFYPNSMPQFPQSKTPSQQQHSFGAIPMQPGGPGGMMPSGFPQSSAPMENNFSAPFNQPPVPANMAQFSQPNPAPNVPSTVAQTFSQNMASLNANNLLANQPKPPQMNLSQGPLPVTQPPSQPVSQSGTQPGTQPGTPAQSPAQAQAQAQIAAREKARVATLLDINSTLLQEVLNLQVAGKAGSTPGADGNASSEAAADPSTANQKPSPEYMECMRRLQANLGYLATIADRAKKSGGVAPQAPGIMSPPPNLPAVHELYVKLNELFPRASRNSTPQKFSPAVSHGNGGPSHSPMSESVM